MSAQENLSNLGIKLPSPPQPKGNYITIKKSGELITLSGQGPLVEGKLLYKGRIGQNLTMEDGYNAAKYSALNILSVIDSEIGLNNIELIKVLGFIVATEDFTDYPAVLNGASDIFLSVLGEHGKHSRSAVGVYGLPFGIPVEIEVVAKII